MSDLFNFFTIFNLPTYNCFAPQGINYVDWLSSLSSVSTSLKIIHPGPSQTDYNSKSFIFVMIDEQLYTVYDSLEYFICFVQYFKKFICMWHMIISEKVDFYVKLCVPSKCTWFITLLYTLHVCCMEVSLILYWGKHFTNYTKPKF